MSINEKTTITIGLLLLILTVFSGGVVWLTTVYADVRANTNAVIQIKQNSSSFLIHIQNIDRRLSNIEGRMGISNSKGE